MNPEDKEEYRRRHLKGWAKERVRRENQGKKNKARRAGRAEPPPERVRRRDWEPDDDDAPETFERMRPRRSEVPVGAAPDPSEGGRVGLVVGVDRNRVVVLVDGRECDAAWGALPFGAAAPTVGDRVRLSGPADALEVTGVEPRTSVLARPDPGDPRREKVLAANVDVAVCVLSVRRPALRVALVDRFLVACARGGVAPMVCVNKMDLLVADERGDVERALAPYREIETPVVFTSAATGQGLSQLAELLHGRVAVFSGHSGVGKSTLLNGLDPEHGRATSEGRVFDGKGRHTTTRSSLVELAGGTRLIDTPGVRAFGLGRVRRDELRFYFADLVALAAGCRFADCVHVHEPECAVRDAVARGALAASRYDAYVRLFRSLA